MSTDQLVIKFVETDYLWPEISVFVEASLSRWAYDDYAKYLGDTEISGIQCPCVVLLDAANIWHRLRTAAWPEGRPTEYRFIERAPITYFENQYRVSYRDAFHVNIPQIVFGHAFEKLRLKAQSKWGARRNWPEIFHVGYHIRNGSFHGNKFHFTVPIQGSPSWRRLHITPDLHGQTVVGLESGVIAFGDIPVLLFELTKALDEA